MFIKYEDMFPLKSNIEMSEMLSLFPRLNENDNRTTYNPNFSPYGHTINRSSSSADSTSPESYISMDVEPSTSLYSPLKSPNVYPSLKGHVPESPTRYDLSTPVMKRQRPIVGRRIATNRETLPVNYEMPLQASPMREYNQSLWQPEESFALQQTPPNNRNFMESVNYQPNVYELFPPVNRGFEFRTPVKTSPTLSSVSPSISNVSPTMSSSPNIRTTNQLPRPFNPNWSSFQNAPRFNQDIRQQKMCTFCRKNGETPLVYMTHMVKEKIGNKWTVTCPILRSHVCSTCGATGDDAHTITYCPVLRSCNNGLPLQSTTITLKNTRILSNGRRRY